MSTFLVLGVEELANKTTKGRTRKTFRETTVSAKSGDARLQASPRASSLSG